MAYPVLHVIERIVAPLGLRVDATSPWVDARLPDGSRVQTNFLRAPFPVLSISRGRLMSAQIHPFAMR
jgi:pilus assembly protein CpaF